MVGVAEVVYNSATRRTGRSSATTYRLHQRPAAGTGERVSPQELMTSEQFAMTSSQAETGERVSQQELMTSQQFAMTSSKLELEKEFHSKKYLSLTERSQLAHDLQLSEVCRRLSAECSSLEGPYAS